MPRACPSKQTASLSVFTFIDLILFWSKRGVAPNYPSKIGVAFRGKKMKRILWKECSLTTLRVSPGMSALNILLLSCPFAVPRLEQLGDWCNWEELRPT